MKNENEKKKPLIALLANNDEHVYCFRKELIEAITDNGYDMLLSCSYGKKLELMKNINYTYDNPVIDRRGTNVFSDFKLYLHYLKLFRAYRPDVVLTFTAKPNVYASIAAKQLKIPYINNVTGFGSILNKNGLLKSFIMQLFKFAYRGSSCVMFQNSTNMQLALDSGMIKGKYRLIPGSGVNIEKFSFEPYPDGGDGISGETIVFNYIGRILHDKGVDDYLAAAKTIKAKYPNTEFNLVGFVEPTESHYEQELSELEKQGIVVYRGNQNDVAPFLARSHATIHPSVYGEGMSNALLETAATGRPIITTDNAGCRETVNDGETGFVYHSGNVDELVEKIEEFLSLSNEKRAKMGALGREKVSTEFNRDKVIENYLNEIKIQLNKKKEV